MGGNRTNTFILAHVPSDCLIKLVTVSESTSPPFSPLFSPGVLCQRERTNAARKLEGVRRNVAAQLSSRRLFDRVQPVYSLSLTFPPLLRFSFSFIFVPRVIIPTRSSRARAFLFLFLSLFLFSPPRLENEKKKKKLWRIRSGERTEGPGFSTTLVMHGNRPLFPAIRVPFNRLREVRREHRNHHDHYSLNPVHAGAIPDRAHLVGVRGAVYLQSLRKLRKG